MGWEVAGQRRGARAAEARGRAIRLDRRQRSLVERLLVRTRCIVRSSAPILDRASQGISGLRRAVPQFDDEPVVGGSASDGNRRVPWCDRDRPVVVLIVVLDTPAGAALTGDTPLRRMNPKRAVRDLRCTAGQGPGVDLSFGVALVRGRTRGFDATDDRSGQWTANRKGWLRSTRRGECPTGNQYNRRAGRTAAREEGSSRAHDQRARGAPGGIASGTTAPGYRPRPPVAHVQFFIAASVVTRWLRISAGMIGMS
jgi:hypothetical protein